jgi:hypothetical protein
MLWTAGPIGVWSATRKLAPNCFLGDQPPGQCAEVRLPPRTWGPSARYTSTSKAFCVNVTEPCPTSELRNPGFSITQWLRKGRNRSQICAPLEQVVRDSQPAAVSRRPSSFRVMAQTDYREVMLFMRAEALAQLGRAEDALADLDGVREDFTIGTFRLVTKKQLTNECLPSEPRESHRKAFWIRGFRSYRGKTRVIVPRCGTGGHSAGRLGIKTRAF